MLNYVIKYVIILKYIFISRVKYYLLSWHLNIYLLSKKNMLFAIF